MFEARKADFSKLNSTFQVPENFHKTASPERKVKRKSTINLQSDYVEEDRPPQSRLSNHVEPP